MPAIDLGAGSAAAVNVKITAPANTNVLARNDKDAKRPLILFSASSP
jgi:hypothetical protein